MESKKIQLILEQEEIDSFKSSLKYVLNNKEISILLLMKMIIMPEYYRKIFRFFESNASTLSIGSLNNNTFLEYLPLNKEEIVDALKDLISKRIVYFDNNEFRSFDNLNVLLQKSKILENSKYYEYYNDNKKYTIDVNKIFDILTMNENDFNNINKDNINNEKRIITYNAVIDFYNKYLNSDDYLTYMHKRYLDIIEIVNIETYKKEDNISSIIINKSLKDKILSGLNDNYNNLEKAIYIYINMCRNLSYDEELYVEAKNDTLVNKHLDTSLVSQIDLNNNEIECLQFSIIYSNILDELKINNKIEEENLHYSVKFLCDEYIVEADSTNKINGDLINAKIFSKLHGLNAINTNNEIKKEFEKTIRKIQKDITNSILKEDVYNDLKITNDFEEKSIEERFGLLTNNLTIKMRSMDILSWILYIRRVLFTENELDNNFSVYFLKNNSSIKPFVSAIFVINNNNYKNDIDNNKYYYFTPNKELRKISLEELKSLFNSGVLTYIKEDDEIVPGVDFVMKK